MPLGHLLEMGRSGKGDNNKSLHGTGGGPCRVNNITEVEQQIDKICHLSSAAAPSGKLLGLPPAQKPLPPSAAPNCKIPGQKHF
ncbi:hypothetical protein FF38_00466 [Lucilia cuprina]|uniref:Uncharacterized protein n=1 Tax=Lucilia cuprina TaxID=7375 RepID=A0A0L0BVR7_LUCCU|nr:hypothetical protein FF38_00466 [Lucilia cuprina]